MPRKQLIHEDPATEAECQTPRQILEAAEDLFLSKGFKGVSMKEVADVVQITPAALYYHFPNGKQDLFVQMIEMVIGEWMKGALKAMQPATTLRERLLLLTQHLLTLPLEQFRLLMRDVQEHLPDQEQRLAVKRVGWRLTQLLADVLQQAIDAGEIEAALPAPVLASLYQGMCTTLLHTRTFAPEWTEQMYTDQLAQRVVSVLLDGIANPPSRPYR